MPLTDDNVLRFSSVSVGLYALHALVAPDHFHDFHHEAKAPRSRVLSRWVGLLLSFNTALNISPTFGGNEQSKKNTLNVSGICWLLVASRNIALALSGYEKKRITVGKVVFGVALGIVSLVQGLRKK